MGTCYYPDNSSAGNAFIVLFISPGSLSTRGVTQFTLVDTDEHNDLGYAFPSEMM